jgi:PTH1 family peptidyl-tRNA hydrolase
MNESGKFIKQYLKYNNNVIPVIVYDDIDLEFAKVKISFGRSAGGHNGVQNVIDELGTEDFIRIRIGIGGKPHKEMLLQDYVISKLSKDEVNQLRDLSKKIESIVDVIVKSGVEKAMEKFN